MPATVFFDEHFLVYKHAYDLFDEKGIALRPVEDSVAQHAGNLFCFEEFINQVTTFLS